MAETLGQQLDSIENMAARLEMMREQEQAMRDVLPVRFELNLAAFRRYIPSIAERFSDYKIKRPFKIFCTDNGIPNLKWRDDDAVFYGENPYEDCMAQVEKVLADTTIIRFNLDYEGDLFGQQHVIYMNELVRQHKSLLNDVDVLRQIPESMPLGLVFGVGLGYQLAYLYERCQIANLFLFEPDEDLFYASLHTFDWAPLLDYLHGENMGMHIFVGQQDNDILTSLREVVQHRAPFLCATTFGLVHYRSDAVNKLVGQIAREMYFISMGWGFFDDNLFSLAHSVDNMRAQVPFFRRDVVLPDHWKEAPVFVIANGPSLDNAIDTIKAYQDKAVIVACGTAITALYRAGIKPDLYMAVERHNLVPGSVKGIADPDYLRDILLVGPDVLHPDCRALFDKKVYSFKADEPMFSMLFANTELMSTYLEVGHINPLVGNCGVSFPLHLGFTNLYLFGIDNGYRQDGHHHSRLSMYYDESGETKNEYKQMALLQGDSDLPGNFGGVVISNPLFTASVAMLEVAIGKFPQARCFNCSDGAAIAGARPMYPEGLNFSRLPVLDKPAFQRFLLTDMASPVPVTDVPFEEYLDVPCFDMLMTRVRQDWQMPLGSRFELVQRMQTQMDYLQQVSQSRQRHMHMVLFGTFNSIFTLLTHLAYSIPDEQQALQAVQTLLPTLDAFFAVMQQLYAHTLDMVQGEHHKVLASLHTA